MRGRHSAILVIALTAVTVRCGASAVAPSTMLKSISVTVPGDLRAGGTAVQALARGYYGDDLSADLTAVVEWSSSNSEVLAVSASGLVTCVGGGDATIRAARLGVVGARTVNVAPAFLTVRGSVIERYGEAPIPGATVTVVSGPDNGRSAVTAGDGTFAIANLSSALLDLSVSANGSSCVRPASRLRRRRQSGSNR